MRDVQMSRRAARGVNAEGESAFTAGEKPESKVARAVWQKIF
jgi:hypothetical protein